MNSGIPITWNTEFSQRVRYPTFTACIQEPSSANLLNLLVQGKLSKLKQDHNILFSRKDRTRSGSIIFSRRTLRFDIKVPASGSGINNHSIPAISSAAAETTFLCSNVEMCHEKNNFQKPWKRQFVSEKNSRMEKCRTLTPWLINKSRQNGFTVDALEQKSPERHACLWENTLSPRADSYCLYLITYNCKMCCQNNFTMVPPRYKLSCSE